MAKKIAKEIENVKAPAAAAAKEDAAEAAAKEAAAAEAEAAAAAKEAENVSEIKEKSEENMTIAANTEEKETVELTEIEIENELPAKLREIVQNNDAETLALQKKYALLKAELELAEIAISKINKNETCDAAARRIWTQIENTLEGLEHDEKIEIAISRLRKANFSTEKVINRNERLQLKNPAIEGIEPVEPIDAREQIENILEVNKHKYMTKLEIGKFLNAAGKYDGAKKTSAAGWVSKIIDEMKEEGKLEKDGWGVRLKQ